jgi:hypothetical protein
VACSTTYTVRGRPLLQGLDTPGTAGKPILLRAPH